MPTTVTALSTPEAGADFETTQLERRDLRADDVRIQIGSLVGGGVDVGGLYCYRCPFDRSQNRR